MKHIDEKTGRNPTVQEIELLTQYYTSIGYEKDTADKILRDSWFAVFDSTSQASTYKGTLIVAIYDMIEFYEIFHVENKTLHRIVFHCLTLDQSMQLTSILHAAVTMRLQQLGYMRKPRQRKRTG